MTPLSETQTFTFDTPKTIRIRSLVNNGRIENVISFEDITIEEVKASSALTAEISREEDNTPEMTVVVNSLRESREKVQKSLGDAIYDMTRNRVWKKKGKTSEQVPKTFKNFNKAMGLIGDQKYTDALEVLKKGKTQTEKNLYKLYKDNPEGLASALTFKYG